MLSNLQQHNNTIPCSVIKRIPTMQHRVNWPTVPNYNLHTITQQNINSPTATQQHNTILAHLPPSDNTAQDHGKLTFITQPTSLKQTHSFQNVLLKSYFSIPGEQSSYYISADQIFILSDILWSIIGNYTVWNEPLYLWGSIPVLVREELTMFN